MRLALVVAVVATAARAQDSAAVRVCDRPATTKIQAAFYGQLATIPMAEMAALGPSYMQDVLEAVRRSWIPGPLSLTVYDPSKGHAELAAATTVIFKVTREGAVHDLGLAASSLSPEFDRAVYSAVRRADSAKLIVPLPEYGPSPVTFYLTVYVSRYPDTVATHPHQPGLVAPMLTTMLPGWEGDITMPAPVQGAKPAYPEYARMSRVEDSLLVRFVIDEKGRVVPSTVFFEAGTYQEFAKSIRDWLPRAKYTPARIGNCTVKSLVTQAFKYNLPH
jgi:TonB-like protein